MQVTIDQLRPYLHSFDFRGLFVEGLGWNHYEAEPVQISLDGHDYALEPVAEKASYVVYVCGADADGLVPPYPIRRKIERRVAKLAFEHIIISTTSATACAWYSRRRGPGSSNSSIAFSCYGCSTKGWDSRNPKEHPS